MVCPLPLYNILNTVHDQMRCILLDLDKNNIISIDVNYNVRPDSMVILQAAKEVVEVPGFDAMLDEVRDRVDEIESLHRTRELTVCFHFLYFVSTYNIMLLFSLSDVVQRRLSWR